jgi:hypothetical protein
MKLVCNATTPQELQGEIVSLLMHRAAQQRAIARTLGSKRLAVQREYAAETLVNIAGEIQNMEIVNQWPSGLTEVIGGTNEA